MFQINKLKMYLKLNISKVNHLNIKSNLNANKKKQSKVQKKKHNNNWPFE